MIPEGHTIEDIKKREQLRQIIKGIYKESVELTSVYLNEGCGKTL